MSDNDKTASRQAELAELDRQIAIRRTTLETGVPPELLQNGRTAEEIAQHASDALAWRADTRSAAAPSTAAVAPYGGTGQISRPLLSQLDSATTMALYRAGRLEGMGAPPPPPRRNGEQHRNAAP